MEDHDTLKDYESIHFSAFYRFLAHMHVYLSAMELTFPPFCGVVEKPLQ